MPIYKYKGYDVDQEIISDTLKAQDEEDLKMKLRDLNVSLISYTALKEKRRSNFFAVSSRVKKSEFFSFCNEFSIMLDTGCELNECLDTLRHQSFSTILKNALNDVYEDVLKGELLSTSFRKHKKIFPEFFCSMVHVGEISASLPKTLRRAAEYYENDIKVKKKASSAMAYPSFLFITVVVIFFFLMLYVVPTFVDMIEQYGQEVNILTQIVINISDFFVNYWQYLIGGIAAFILLTYLFFKTKKGKYVKEVLLMHLPLISAIKRNTLTTRFATSLAILLDSGIEVLDAMKEMKIIMNNEYFSKRFQYAIEEVNNGKKISRAIENTGLFPNLLIQMVRTGEETGSIPYALEKIGKYYQEVLDESIKKATSMLEPIVIVIMGLLVGVVLLAVMLPIFQMTTAPLG